VDVQCFLQDYQHDFLGYNYYERFGEAK